MTETIRILTRELYDLFREQAEYEKLDLYKLVASRMFGVEYRNVTPVQRADGKRACEPFAWGS